MIQLEPRLGQPVVAISVFPSHSVLRLCAASALVVRATVRKDACCVVASGSMQAAVRLLGQSLRAEDLLLAGPGARMDLFIRHGATLFALIATCPRSMPRRALRVCANAEAIGGDAATVFSYMKGSQECVVDTDAELVGCLQRLAAGANAPGIEGAFRTPRVSAVISACRLVDERFPAALSLDDLSRYCCVAERTLEYGFKHVYGTTPLSFIRSQRLTRSRLALLYAKHPASISQTARAFGFTHMGQYCRDYRRLFGETPSMTLARREGCRSLKGIEHRQESLTGPSTPDPRGGRRGPSDRGRT